MRAAFLLVLLLLSAATAVQAQQSGPDRERRAVLEARRDSLEAEIMARFLEQLSRELRLDAQQRVQTERVLREGGMRRRELTRASGELRSRLHRATRAADTPDAEFHRMMAEHETLRHRENELWRREQDELARILTPRQRAQFLVQWVRFQDRVRDIIAQQLRSGGDPRH